MNDMRDVFPPERSIALSSKHRRGGVREGEKGSGGGGGIVARRTDSGEEVGGGVGRGFAVEGAV